MMEDRDMDELIRLSLLFGADPDIIQAGGGNASLKAEGLMRVTASGMRLRDIGGVVDFVPVETGMVRSILDDGSVGSLPGAKRDAEAGRRLLLAIKGEMDRRPSVETFLHAIMPGRLVAHLHPVHINAMTCSENGREVASVLFDNGEFVWLPYKLPGFSVGRALLNEVEAHIKDYSRAPGPGMVFMENHGIIVSGEDASLVEQLARRAIRAVAQYYGGFDAHAGKNGTGQGDGLMEALNEACGPGDTVYRWSECPYVGLLSSRDDVRETLTRGCLTPDQAYYCGEQPLVVTGTGPPGPAAERLMGFKEKRGYWPRYVISVDRGVLVAGTDMIDEVLSACVKVALLITKKGRPRYLPVADSGYLAGLGRLVA
jgi:rhamnose utilization protein RhaD (predicted bifunctional aldolase and dehydrogenase)